MGGKALDVDCHKGAVFTGISTFIQSSNGIRIFAGALASTGAEAELYCTSAELFWTSVVAKAPGIAVASVDTGAPFNTGSSVVTYIF